MLKVRPKVAELQFQVYTRALHPELFTVHCSRAIERSKYKVVVDITSAGHVVTWRAGDILTLTEVAAAANHPLPERRRLLKHRLLGKRSDFKQCRDGIEYHVGFQLDRVEPELFWSIQQELSKEGRSGMLHSFQSSGRIALGAMSYVNIEARDRSLLVQAFHTFPDDCAIVKVQSKFQLP